ncbi:trypsin-like serine peptidase [Ralstonia pseudosolanacearum]|uniref:trypsin-like serine peptidase n=1 Tax=Ralstonia pseudosolanacearum TaxID=1310165 RepID=UPI000E57F661|nr:hypothetical protein [Ralstonia pseudosolanacearum]AXW09563.1 hypothetical protein CJO83_03270 [Ralstonia solanacearum]AXW42158.1 hypothetical protein CJO90_03265 [Ralstonia solanacearum]AXW46869.1 hypothetical protein CJO91_03570 [Ralstonia solanacearum]
MPALQARPDLAVRNSAASADLALQQLRPTDRSRVLLDAFGAPSGQLLRPDQLSEPDLNQRMQIANARAKVTRLQKVLDPTILEAYLGKPPGDLTVPELLKRTEDTYFRTLSLQLDPLIKLALYDPNVAMVGVGVNGNAGGLANLPKPLPVVFALTKDNKRCLRPAQRSDYLLDPGSNRIHRVWDPEGFRDVGMLVWRTVGAPPDDLHLCSFVRVSRNLAVTAAHCVVDSVAGQQPVHARNLASADLDTIALLPRLDGSELRPLDCFTQPDNCGYFVARVQVPAELPHPITWVDKAAVPQPDIAMLTLPFGADAPEVGIRIAAKLEAQKLTLAGYGLTDVKSGAFERGSLLVGWQERPPSLESTTLVWSVDLRNGAATGCGGDSGGAVYDGDIAGAPGEVRTLGAIISTTGPASSNATTEITKCEQAGYGRAARLDIHYAWLCGRSNGAIRGCAQTMGAVGR